MEHLSEATLIKMWNAHECVCTKESTNPDCPLNEIICILRHQLSFRVFKNVVKSVGSIARSKPERQKRKGHIRYISKCNSGPFYHRMSATESEKIKAFPFLYTDSDSVATGEITEASATEEMEYTVQVKKT